MPYISKRTLHYKSGFINKGGVVPRDYPRLEEGLKRGWIKLVGDPAAKPPPVKATTESAATVETEIIAPEAADQYAESPIENLEYLMPMAKESLAAKDVVNISNLEGWDVESLDELRGIGVKLAERLLADFAKWKESFSEYADTEDDNAESATEAAGEDAGPEDD